MIADMSELRDGDRYGIFYSCSRRRISISETSTFIQVCAGLKELCDNLKLYSFGEAKTLTQDILGVGLIGYCQFSYSSTLLVSGQV